MANYVSIQRKIDRGRGIAGRVLGQPYNVYRSSANAAGSVIDPINLVRGNFPILRRRISSKDDIEAPERMGTLFYELVGDMSTFLTGDIFVQHDPVYGLGNTLANFPTAQFDGFALASHAPIKKSLGARVDRVAQFYRPSGTPDATGYWNTTPAGNRPIILSSGVYSVGPVGTPATRIPVGFQGAPNMRSGAFKKVPGDVGTQQWYCYVPPLSAVVGSFSFREGDRLIDYDGARYVVKHPYRQEAGFVGSMLMIERELPA